MDFQGAIQTGSSLVVRINEKATLCALSLSQQLNCKGTVMCLLEYLLIYTLLQACKVGHGSLSHHKCS